MLVDLVRVSTADGVRLEGALRSPTAPPADAIGVDAFLLIHGTGGNFYGSTLFDALADRLLELGSAVLTVNTRGHDVICNVSTTSGGRRIGAAYEHVDDCRHDLDAWIGYLQQQGCRRIGLLGHSLGAIKAIHSQAHAPHPAVVCLIGVSPARLSHAWYLQSARAEVFRETMARAQALVAAGQGETLMAVDFPLPYVVTAGGYIDKYGEAEHYNIIPRAALLKIPTLITFGSVEAATNVAFVGLPEALEQAAATSSHVTVATIAGGDHFYSGVRAELASRVERWLRRLGPASKSV